MKTANTLIDISTDRSLCSNAGTLLLADATDRLGVTDTLDSELAGLAPSRLPTAPGRCCPRWLWP